MINIRKVLKVCEQAESGGFVLHYNAHPDADYNPVRQPQSGDLCTPYFFKTDILEEAVKQRDAVISVFDRAEELNSATQEIIAKTNPTPIHLKQPPSENLKKSAAALMEMKYPAGVKDNMRDAFLAGKYQDVQEIAANHDLVTREKMDTKITQIPNPDFKMIKGNVVEMSQEGKDSDKQISPYLFKAEGIDRTFTSAAAAISAYKEKNNITLPDTRKHQIRKNHIDGDERSSANMPQHRLVRLAATENEGETHE